MRWRRYWNPLHDAAYVQRMRVSDFMDKWMMFAIVIIILLISFDVYYFFIRRGVGPSYYIGKLGSTPEKNMLESIAYRDKVEGYDSLNRQVGSQKVVLFLAIVSPRSSASVSFYPAL